MFAQEQVDGHCSSACKQLDTPSSFRWWPFGGLKVDGGAPCLSDPLHFIPDRLVGGGLQVVAEGAAEPDLMTGLCSALRLLSG